MLTIQEAREIGRKACIELIGEEFCIKHADNAVVAYGEDEVGITEVFVGISDELSREISGISKSSLSCGKRKWPFAATCKVYRIDSHIEFIEYRTPYKDNPIEIRKIQLIKENRNKTEIKQLLKNEILDLLEDFSEKEIEMYIIPFLKKIKNNIDPSKRETISLKFYENILKERGLL